MADPYRTSEFTSPPAPVVVPAPPSNIFTPEEIATLETSYRRIAVVTHEEGEYAYAFKPAERLQWRAFRAAASDDDKRSDAQETLIKQCVVAVKYAGKAAFSVAEARALLDSLLSDYVSATDGKAVSQLVFRVNGQAGAGK